MSEIKEEQGYFYMPLTILSYQLDKGKKLSPVAVAEILQEAAGTHANYGGFGYHQVFSHSSVWVLNSLRFEVNQFPVWEENITVKTWVVGSQRFISRRDFEVLNEKGEVLIAATSNWILYNFERKRPMSIDTLDFNVVEHPENYAVRDDIEMTKEFVSSEFPESYIVKYSDLDMVGHMNNTRYIRNIFDSYPIDILESKSLSSFEIQFRSEAKFDDKLMIHSSMESRNQYKHEITRPSDLKSICFARVSWR